MLEALNSCISEQSAVLSYEYKSIILLHMFEPMFSSESRLQKNCLTVKIFRASIKALFIFFTLLSCCLMVRQSCGKDACPMFYQEANHCKIVAGCCTVQWSPARNNQTEWCTRGAWWLGTTWLFTSYFQTQTCYWYVYPIQHKFHQP